MGDFSSFKEAGCSSWISVACRECHAGWWGEVVPSFCPYCRGTVHLTGRGASRPVLPRE